MSASEQIATPTRPDFARGQRMIGIHAHLRGQIESHGESGDALREQIAVTPVALLGRAETGVLAHGPEPAAVHLRVNAAGVTELARQFAWVAMGDHSCS